MLPGREEIVELILNIPEELAEIKGTKERLLMKPLQTIGIEVNGIYYPDLRALQVLEDTLVVFHSPQMVRVEFKEVNDFGFR